MEFSKSQLYLSSIYASWIRHNLLDVTIRRYGGLTPTTGCHYRAAHPRLQGRILHQLSDEWDGILLEENEKDPYLTADAAAYPSDLNKFFAT